jgi:chlorite dismutase
MAQETLKITITADNQQAVKNIQETVTATTKLGTAFKTLPNTSNQATNALTNLSRVAQDAPYGFIGIANNLNPLLESFQRLQKEAGGSGAALKAMAGGLMGPAGIGLALGAVSSIIVAFGPKIADFINGTNKATEAEDKFAQSLSDARAEASETGIRLQAYLSITQNANVSDARRAEALKAVQNELGKVNSAYAATITTVDQARKAVDLYTEALVSQALTSRYIDEIANKTIALAEANKKIIQSGREYYKELAIGNSLINQNVYATIGQADVINNAAKANADARKEAVNLKNGIIGLNTELANTITLALNNPFFQLDKGAKQLANTTKEVADNIQRIGKQARPLVEGATNPVTMERGAAPTITPPTGNAPLGGRTSGFNAISATRDINEQAKAQAILNMQLAQTQEITNLIAPAFNSVIEAMAMGEDIGLALEQAFKQIVVQLVQMIAQALLFKAIMAGISGGTSEIGSSIGSGLGMLFGGNGGGQFVLKGQDLLLATNRAQKASNLKGQSISLA